MKVRTPHIVVGVLATHATTVLGQAIVFAKHFDAVLACANVNPARRTASYAADGTVISVPLVPGRPTVQPGLREEVDSAFAAEVEAVLQGSGVEWTLHALAGDPARELELLADRLDADMIIVGTRGAGAREVLRELFNGSVADRLVFRQHRPVVVVPLSASGQAIVR